MPFYLLYFLLLFLISYLSSSGWKNQVFFSAKKYSWIVTGLSLFMFLLSADQGQLAFEVIKKGSIWTMWQFWSVMVGVFIVPIIFAPFWQRCLAHDYYNYFNAVDCFCCHVLYQG
jgi:hypothetical protein